MQTSVEKANFFTRSFQAFITMFHAWKTTFKEEGFRGIVRRYGWKALGAVFVYYLVRDSFLYILIPYLIARGVF